jgi:hypothetical protein
MQQRLELGVLTEKSTANNGKAEFGIVKHTYSRAIAHWHLMAPRYTAYHFPGQLTCIRDSFLKGATDSLTVI